MITLRKIEIFDRYRGEVDAWARTGSTDERSAMSDRDWYEIGALVQDIAAVRSGRVSAQFAERLERKLSALGDDPALVPALRCLA